jgi:hypothetical protein
MAGLAVPAARAATPDREALRQQLASFVPKLEELVINGDTVDSL